MNKCVECNGKGYFLDINKNGNIERCDECMQFKSDKKAKEYYLKGVVNEYRTRTGLDTKKIIRNII